MSPSSPGTDLRLYREKMEELNFKFFLCLEERKHVAGQIQTFKTGSGRYPHFDPEREKTLFSKMRDQLLRLSLRELLGFSLIMESQAGAATDAYPSWSTGAHLRHRSGELHSQVNPLLLQVSHPELFKELPLGQDFAFLKDF